MLDGRQVFGDERCGGDLHVHCPQHAQAMPWVGDLLGAWRWTRKGRPLGEYAASPAAWVFDGIAILDQEFGALEGEFAKATAEAQRTAGA